MSEDRELAQRVRSAIARVPVTEHPLGARAPRRAGVGLLPLAAAVVVLVAAIGAGRWLSDYRAASAAAGSCGSLDAGIVPQAPKPIRTIRLDQRWTVAGVGTLCVAGIHVYDGTFDIVSYEQGVASYAEPWTSAGAGMSLGILTDDRGRMFAGTSSRGFANGASGNVSVSTYRAFVTPGQESGGDLLAGVHELHYTVHQVLDAVRGPWRFGGIPAKNGPLTETATASGRDMHLYDLVLRSDGFSVAYLPLGQVTPGTVVLSDALRASDDRGTTYASKGFERVGSSPNLYAKFTPAPPPGALLTVEIPTIYVASDRSWEGALTLPGASSPAPAFTSSPSPIRVTIDPAQFIAANGATFVPQTFGSDAIPESEARQRAETVVPTLAAVKIDSGLLTSSQLRLDRRPVWYVTMHGKPDQTEYMFIDASNGRVLWQFGTAP